MFADAQGIIHLVSAMHRSSRRIRDSDPSRLDGSDELTWRVCGNHMDLSDVPSA